MGTGAEFDFDKDERFGGCGGVEGDQVDFAGAGFESAGDDGVSEREEMIGGFVFGGGAFLFGGLCDRLF